MLLLLHVFLFEAFGVAIAEVHRAEKATRRCRLGEPDVPGTSETQMRRDTYVTGSYIICSWFQLLIASFVL